METKVTDWELFAVARAGCQFSTFSSTLLISQTRVNIAECEKTKALYRKVPK